MVWFQLYELTNTVKFKETESRKIVTWAWEELLLVLSIIFNWRITAWQYCIGFCHTSTWISHRYKYVPSLLKLPLISHPILPLPVVTEHWIWAACTIEQIPTGYLISLMIRYMFQCDSLHLSHPLLPPLCPQVCSLCLHLHCFSVDRIISTFLLHSVYVLKFVICLSLSDLLRSV